MNSRFLHHGLFPGTEPLNHYLYGLQNQEHTPLTLITQPDRGPGSDMVARSLAALEGLPVDLQPYGWRLSRAAGIDQRRIDAALHLDTSTLADAMEEEGISEIQTLKVQFFGPLSLAAQVHLPQGEKILSDHGAFSELAIEQAAGQLAQLKTLAEDFSVQSFETEIFEPLAAKIMGGHVATASGYERLKGIDRATVGQKWEALIQALSSLEEEEGPSVSSSINFGSSSTWSVKKTIIPQPFRRFGWGFDENTKQDFGVLVDLASHAGFRGLHVPPGLSPHHWEMLAAWIEADNRIVFGADTQQPVTKQLEEITQGWFQQGLTSLRLVQTDVSSNVESSSLSDSAHRKLISTGGELADALNQRANT